MCLTQSKPRQCAEAEDEGKEYVQSLNGVGVACLCHDEGILTFLKKPQAERLSQDSQLWR
jgi:acetylornithine/succinyldiaminopimelate/putrescine aminotransferase